MNVLSSFSLVPAIQTHHSGPQGRDIASRRHSGGSSAVAACGGCSWLRTGLSSPRGLLAVAGCSVGPSRLFNGLCDCRRWPLALVCLWDSGFCVAGLWDSLSESGGGLPPRRCACTVSRAPVCASALAVAAAASSTARRTRGSSHLAAVTAASAAARRAAAAALSAGLCRRTVGLIAGSGLAVAEALAALA
jgi:hypothetical protein